jgi:hypothetical protein
MKTILFLALAATALAQSSSTTIQFVGTSVGATLTVNAAGFPPEINGIEVTQVVGGCSGITLQSGITSTSTSITLTGVPASCTITPGMGIYLGCAAGGGSCTSGSTIKAAGCSGSPLSCPVVQGQLGTTPGTYATGTAVTILLGGDGNQFVCAVLLQHLKFLAQLGAVGYVPAAVPSAASTAVATQNSTIQTAIAANTSTISGAFTCTPTQ